METPLTIPRPPEMAPKHHSKSKDPNAIPTITSNRPIKVIEQNFNLNIKTKSQSIEGVTTFRICALPSSFNVGAIGFGICAKQMNISNVEISQVSMHNKFIESPNTSEISAQDYALQYSYPGPDLQLKTLKTNFSENCPRNINTLIKMSQDAYNIENEGYLKIILKFLSPESQNVEDLFGRNFCCYLTLKVSFNISDPLVGGFFKPNPSDKSVTFIKENKTSYTRNILPCLDGIDDYYKIGQVKILVDDPRMTCLASGDLVSTK